VVATRTDCRYQAAKFQECRSDRNGAICQDHHSDIHELLSHSGVLLRVVARLTTLTSCRFQDLSAQECRPDKCGVIPLKHHPDTHDLHSYFLFIWSWISER
jgi:hypothetical protein